jgi:antitoxin MazE
MMTTKIQKWGNSFAIRLPRALFQSGKFTLGSEVTLEEKGAEIVLKVVKRKYPSLKEIMKTIKPGDLQAYDWGPPVGKEIIK